MREMKMDHDVSRDFYYRDGKNMIFFILIVGDLGFDNITKMRLKSK